MPDEGWHLPTGMDGLCESQMYSSGRKQEALVVAVRLYQKSAAVASERGFGIIFEQRAAGLIALPPAA